MTIVPRVAAALALGALLARPAAAHAQQDAVAFAQRRFEHGVELFDAHAYGPALDEFQASIALYASPNPRLYVARCLVELGRLGDAELVYERTAREAADRARLDPRYAATSAAATRELAEIEPRVGRVTVTLAPRPPGARLGIRGSDLPSEALGLAIPVTPGRVELELSARGYATAHRTLEVAAGASAHVTVTLVPLLPPPGRVPPRPLDLVPAARIAGVAELAVGVVGAAGWATFGLLSNSAYATLLQHCGQLECTGADDVALTARGRTYMTLTNIGLGLAIGGVSLGVLTLVLFGREAPRADRRVAIGPGVFALQF